MMQNFSDAVYFYFLNYGTLMNIKTSGATEYRGRDYLVPPLKMVDEPVMFAILRQYYVLKDI